MAERRTIQMRRSGRVWIQVVIVLIGGAFLAALALSQFFRSSDPQINQTVILHTVAKSDFDSFISEPGDISSSSNVEIRCKVKSQGTSGVTILKIVEEGSYVKKGDFLVQFDDSVLKNDRTEQQILVAKDKAALIQAKSDLENAKRNLTEFEEGIFEQEKEVIEGEVFVAQENLRRAQAHLNYSRRLWSNGFISDIQLRADEFAVEKADKDVDVAERKLRVYEKFTRDKMVGELRAEIEKQKANVEAAENTQKLSQQKLADIDEQIQNCSVTAPQEGQVIYANERERRETNIVIEEGVSIRDGQRVIMLPDIKQMEANTRVNEAHINKVSVGNHVRIELEADPELEVVGEVIKVSDFPFPLRWWGAPLEYGVKVKIKNPPPLVRPGLRAKVHIYTTREPDVMQVPIAAVINHNDNHFCLVRDGEAWDARPVRVGPTNSNFVVVRTGLEVGDRVAIDPFRFIERSDLPAGASPMVDQASSRTDSNSTRPKPVGS